MTSVLPALWEFEPAEPDVGILTDSVTHTCDANAADERWEPAEIADVTRANVWVTHPSGEREEKVAETTTLRCPACQATTAYTEHWPLWFFETSEEH